MEVLFKNKKTPVNIEIKENELLNNFIVVDSNMNEVNTKDIKGNKLILTVPSVDTRVCSIELAKFIGLLKEEDIQVITVSMDLPFALDRWCQNHSDKVIACSDFRYHQFDKVTGLLMKDIGLFSRSVMVVDEHNVIQYLEIVENTHTEPNYENVLNIIKNMKKD